jgi:hypothetical protein
VAFEFVLVEGVKENETLTLVLIKEVNLLAYWVDSFPKILFFEEKLPGKTFTLKGNLFSNHDWQCLKKG